MVNLKNHSGIPPGKPRFGRPRVLIVGCGDIGMRLLPLLRARFRVFALTSQPARCAELRAAGAVPVLANLDRPHTLARLARLAPTIVHLAPPQGQGSKDLRTRNLIAILPEGATVVYISTSGVYGDCGGALVHEWRTVNPQSARAARRVDAERALRTWARRTASRLAILRVPGIYAGDRLPVERLQRASPALRVQDDVYTNHIHADDLARIVAAALFHARPCRTYHASDDSQMKMGDYFDAVAEALGLPLAPRLAREELERSVSPLLLSFMSESRRLSNQRIKAELGVRLAFPRVTDALRLVKDKKNWEPA
jgi:nucleoside-diphosphate-sugar epimerase